MFWWTGWWMGPCVSPRAGAVVAVSTAFYLSSAPAAAVAAFAFAVALGVVTIVVAGFAAAPVRSVAVAVWEHMARRFGRPLTSETFPSSKSNCVLAVVLFGNIRRGPIHW